MKAQVVGGPDDGKKVPVEPGQRTIQIHQGGQRWNVPIRCGRIMWNERKAA